MVTRHVLSITAVCLSLASCFSDLPAATTCPAAPQRAVGDCLQVFQSTGTGPMMPGCFPKSAHECLLGPRVDCSCGASECPESASACNPAPDCPDAVRKIAANATCPRAQAADATPCVCGCVSCLAVCDGYGPTLGVVVPPGGAPTPLLSVPLGGSLPASGKLGFYVRLRGASRMIIRVVRGTDTVAQQLAADSFAFDSQFREVTLAPDTVAWASADQAPTAIQFGALPGPGTDPAVTYVQVDCVVPILLR